MFYSRRFYLKDKRELKQAIKRHIIQWRNKTSHLREGVSSLERLVQDSVRQEWVGS